MTRTAVIFSPRYYQHDPGGGHPESARRLRVIVDELKRGPLSNSRTWQFISPKRARIEDVELIHDIDYVRHVERVCKSGGGALDSGDTVVSRRSFDVALYAVGGTLKAVNLVMERRFENAFALIRPPGHHAGRFQAMGFCLFNNVAIAAVHLLRNFRLKRILVLDVDAHHGNGTQETFYETDKVLYISLHQDPRQFPGAGFIDETGQDGGLGYTINIPLPFKTGDQIYLRAFKEIVLPIASQYRPEFVLISAGLDGHYADPVGQLSLSTLCYDQVYESIVNLTSEICKGRLVSVLEGGYGLNHVGKTAAAVLARMSRSRYVVEDRLPIFKASVRKTGERVLDEVKKVQRSFWALD